VGDDRPASLGFPDLPRSQLEKVIEELVGTAQNVLQTQGRLRSLLSASRIVSGELDLPVVLRRIVEAGVDLVGARYGAVGVIAPDGTLEQFIHVGMPPDSVERIGHLPEGHGLLGALIEEQVPIRLEHIHDDPRSAGFPASHPAMDSFLGVPIRVRDEIYGNLYLSESRAGAFSEEDQELLIALASTAGAAIDHARLFGESQLRQRWSAASAEVGAALLSEQAEDSLGMLADRVADLTAADLVCVILPLGAAGMVIEVARGSLAAGFQGSVFESFDTTAGRAMESGQPVLSESPFRSRVDPDVVVGPTMAVPLSAADDETGVLTVSRLPGAPRFTAANLDMVADFASQASVALRLAAARIVREKLALLEDRSRIARDLHDHVIQRLFGAGLGLQGVAGRISDADSRRAVLEHVDTLDAAIKEIRTAIFAMTSDRDADAPSLRHRVIEVMSDAAPMLAEHPRLTFDGPVDLLVPAAMIDDVVAVTREGLANVAKHASATFASVVISVDGDRVVVTIEDDGKGLSDLQVRQSGTANLDRRAQLWGGAFELKARVPRGTTLQWTVPLEGVRA